MEVLAMFNPLKMLFKPFECPAPKPVSLLERVIKIAAVVWFVKMAIENFWLKREVNRLRRRHSFFRFW